MSTLLVTHATPLPQVAYAAASILAGYTPAGSFSQGVQFMTIVSTLDAAVNVSFDGVHDHIAVPAGNTVPVCIPLDFAANLTVLQAAPIFVKRIGVPGSGNIYFSAFGRTP